MKAGDNCCQAHLLNEEANAWSTEQFKAVFLQNYKMHDAHKHTFLYTFSDLQLVQSFEKCVDHTLQQKNIANTLQVL